MLQVSPDPIFEGVYVGDFVQDTAYGTVRPNGTTSWLVMISRRGAGLVRVAGKSAVAGEGTVVWLPPQTPHAYRTDPSAGLWDFGWIHFFPRSEWSAWLPVGPGPFVDNPPAHMFERIVAWHRQAHELRFAVGRAEREMARALTELILLGARGGAAAETQDPAVAEGLRFIRENFRVCDGVGPVVSAMGLGRSQASARFKAAVGRSIRDEIERVRLVEAQRWLSSGLTPIHVVSDQIGFRNEFYFSRRFREAFGISPRQYRSQVFGTLSPTGTNPNVKAS